MLGSRNALLQQRYCKDVIIGHSLIIPNINREISRNRFGSHV